MRNAISVKTIAKNPIASIQVVSPETRENFFTTDALRTAEDTDFLKDYHWERRAPARLQDHKKKRKIEGYELSHRLGTLSPSSASTSIGVLQR